MPPHAGGGEMHEGHAAIWNFVAVLISFVVIGCLATRAPKKMPKKGAAKK
jgi:hypothetical protein